MEKQKNKRHSIQKIDIEYYSVFIITLILSIIGVIMISSASISIGERYFNDPYWFIRRQVIWWALSFIFFIIASRINYRFYQKISYFIILIVIGLLALVLIPGFSSEIGGARRWLNLWFFNIQPSEFAKLALIILFSDSLDRKYRQDLRIKEILFPPFFILCLITILIFLEPDMSTVILIWIIIFILLFVGNARLKHIMGLGLIGIVVTIGYMFLEDYRRERILAFINQSGNSEGVNFQVTQSLIALGSGQVMGLGLGNSVQKYSYLPESHTDFIFAIIGEEFGLIGTIFIVVLYILFVIFGIRVCIKAKDYFGRVMAIGFVGLIIVPAIINISVVIGILPVTGLSLPFISFGGSSLLVSMISVGILLNISRHNITIKKLPENLES